MHLGQSIARIPLPTRWLLVVAWMAVLFGLSGLSGSSVPGQFATPGHFFLYAVLGSLVWIAVYRPGNGTAAIAIAVLISSAYGVTDEFHQSFVPGRMPDIVDWGVDTVGALVGAGLVWFVACKRGARRHPSA